jgi:hypothetical protein
MSTPTRPCEICGQPIDPERLEAVPDTRLCVDHARKIAKYGGEFRITATHERTSKQGSLKKNYGGISAHKVRNPAAIEKLRQEYEEEKQQQQ